MSRFGPLAARQILRARVIDVQTARNDAVLLTANAYFNVQQARGRLAGDQDVIAKARALSDKVRAMFRSPVPTTDENRALALAADLMDTEETSREQWRVASADLAQVLRLDPALIVAPLEPADLRITLVPPQSPVDDLIPIGLTNRPELASQQALVQAALARIRQERWRPLIPSLVLQGGAGPAGGSYLMGGIFASGANGKGNPTQPRDDMSAQIVWGLENLGFGNRAVIRRTRAEQQQLLIDVFRIQDTVAAEIVRAHAQLRSAARRLAIAERTRAGGGTALLCRQRPGTWKGETGRGYQNPGSQGV